MKPSTNKVNGHQPKKGNPIFLKKGTNIRWNSAIFFQVGLIIALLASVFAMDLKIGEKPSERVHEYTLDLNNDFFDDFVVDEPVKEKPKKPIAKKEPTPEPPKAKLIDKVKRIDDNSKEIETKVADPTTEITPDPPVVEKPAPPVKPVDTRPTYVNSVEFAPVFPGCESLSNNKERIQCLSTKISAFVSRKFNTSVAHDDTRGTQRINVQFKIDKNGQVTDIIAIAKDKALEKEAHRVLSKLPTFTPGRQGDTKVDVLYMLPIVFKMQ